MRKCVSSIIGQGRSTLRLIIQFALDQVQLLIICLDSQSFISILVFCLHYS